MDVLSMWACLHDQDTTGQWKQVAGWRKVCDLALAHLGRLREYRRGLAEAWPPETNAAARAYVGELDQLIERVQHTHDAAAANYDALAAAARAIGSARTQLQPLHDEYATKLRQKRAYEATIADPKAVAGSRLPERPPVTDDDLEQLNVRARGLMTGLSGELQQAQVMLQRPPLVRRPGIETNNSDVYGLSQAPPIIPPIVPVAITSTPSEPAPSRSGSRPQSSPIAANAAGVGPILGGAGPTLTPPAAPTAPGSTATQPSSLGGGILPPPGTTSRMTPKAFDKPPIPRSGGKAVTGGGTPPASAPRPTYPNGLIGQPPGALSQPSPRGAASRRINPFGGVIGGGGAGTTPTGSAGPRPGIGRGPLMGPQGGAPHPGFPPGAGWATRKQEPPGTSRVWDTDNPWTTQEGVSPIVLPPDEEGPIDPGPAIGRHN
ncbi:hypothetical protein O7619_08245 [Micromonospora sp. WMMD998]|nr:hypothetical protein [Micromonospora sp. WMMD998]WFE42566.1 hypothetical protein O7619_08245 [Micromonospora sp. WMMD998]